MNLETSLTDTLRLWNPLTSGRTVLPSDVLSELIVSPPALRPVNFPTLSVHDLTEHEPPISFVDLTGINLNRPPDNWLSQNGSTPMSVQQQGTDAHTTTELTRTAALLHDADESCDFVASVEALQHIFSAPVRSRSTPLAMSLHRVGNAIVIDGSSMKMRASKTVRECHEKALKSKLLYYSVLAGFQPGAPNVDGGSEYPRAINWRFNDLQLLIGSSVPILHDSKHGVDMSLHLHEAGKSIPRDDAIEMWLENVLNNLSHVGLCYHADGIVQGYQIINTQDIPKMSLESSFEPKVIQEFSGRVLQWMKANCTEEGGSYLLLKDPATGNLQLYDMSTMKNRHDKDTAALRYPSAMMYFRVAQTILSQPRRSTDQVLHAISYLEKVTELLDPALDKATAVQTHQDLITLYLEMAQKIQSSPTPPPQQQQQNAETCQTVQPRTGGEYHHPGHTGSVVRKSAAEARFNIVTHMKAVRQLDPDTATYHDKDVINAYVELFRTHLTNYELKECVSVLIELQDSIFRLPKTFMTQKPHAPYTCVLAELMGDLYHHITKCSTNKDSNQIDLLQEYLAAVVMSTSEKSPPPPAKGNAHGGQQLLFDIVRYMTPVSDNPESNYHRALQYYQLAPQSSAARKVADLHNFLGQHYISQQRFTKALEAFTKAKDGFMEVQDEVNASVVDVNRANVYLRKAENAHNERKDTPGMDPAEEDSLRKAIDTLGKAVQTKLVVRHRGATQLLLATRMMNEAVRTNTILECEAAVSKLLQQSCAAFEALGDKLGYHNSVYYAAQLHYNVLKFDPTQQYEDRRSSAINACQSVIEFFKTHDGGHVMVPKVRCLWARLIALSTVTQPSLRIILCRSACHVLAALEPWFRFHEVCEERKLSVAAVQEEYDSVLGLVREMLKEWLGLLNSNVKANGVTSSASATSNTQLEAVKAAYRQSLVSKSITEILSTVGSL